MKKKENGFLLQKSRKNQLQTNQLLAEKQKQEVETEIKCSVELQEAMQVAMKGYTRMLE